MPNVVPKQSLLILRERLKVIGFQASLLLDEEWKWIRRKDNKDDTSMCAPGRKKGGRGRGKLKRKRGVAAGEFYCLWCVISTPAPSSLAAWLQASLDHTKNTGHLHESRGQVSNASSDHVFSPQELLRLWRVHQGYICAPFSGKFCQNKQVYLVQNSPSENWTGTDFTENLKENSGGYLILKNVTQSEKICLCECQSIIFFLSAIVSTV